MNGYSLALGYNYRYITLQIAKLENKLDIKNFMLEGWPRSRRQFLARYRSSCSIPRFIRYWVFRSLPKRSYYRLIGWIPWCTPPEIIKVFWWAFLIGIFGVMTSACLVKPSVLMLAMVIPVGIICIIVGFFVFPWNYGRKLYKQCKQEPKNWTSDQPN